MQTKAQRVGTIDFFILYHV
jgi:hypothetical protein